MRNDTRVSGPGGYALVSVLGMVTLLLFLLGSYRSVTVSEILSSRSQKEATSGFFAAEGALNRRAETVRGVFAGFNLPAGVPPRPDTPACVGGNDGSGDYRCVTFDINGRRVTTWLTEPSTGQGSPDVIPESEPYGGLTRFDFEYTANALARNLSGETEADLTLRFRTRYVPLFQFAAFYQRDLEMTTGPDFSLSGPVHSNGNIYIANGTGPHTYTGPITTGERLFRGSKFNQVCSTANPVRIQTDKHSAASLLSLPCPSSATSAVPASTLAAWAPLAIKTGAKKLTVPDLSVLDPVPDNQFFRLADLRLAMDVSGPVPLFRVLRDSGAVDPSASARLGTCPGSLSGSAVGRGAFYSIRENGPLDVFDVDMEALLTCLGSTDWLGTGEKTLDDLTQNGLVMHMTVLGPRSSLASSRYSVRIRNGTRLRSADPSHPRVRGLSIISDQAVTLMGDYNSRETIPAAVMSDTIGALSGGWKDTNCSATNTSTYPPELGRPPEACHTGNRTRDDKVMMDARHPFRPAGAWFDPTVGTPDPVTGENSVILDIRAAFLSGNDDTIPVNVRNSGGLENFIRFYECLDPRTPGATGSCGIVSGAYPGGIRRLPQNGTVRYRGSFVSLGPPRHSSGRWGRDNSSYNTPLRDWGFDASFVDPARLPPMTPNFVILNQKTFVRDLDRSDDLG